MTMILALIAIGMVAGILSGLLGLGGGAVIVPALVVLFGFSQKMAQGTTLVMLLPPIGLLAAWTYYQHGNVDLRAAALLASGFGIGGLLGSLVAGQIDDAILAKIFGVFLIVVGVKMLL